MDDGADAGAGTDPASESTDVRDSPDASSPPDSLTGSLRLAAREHRAYFLASMVVFAAGVVAGVAMVATGFDLFEAMGRESAEDLFPENVTVVSLFVNNTMVYFLSILGALTLGLLPLTSLVFNGLVVGYVGSLVAAEMGVAFVVVGVAPHGVLELPAIFAAAAVAFRLVHRGIDRARGRREVVMTRAEWRRTALFVLFFWAVLALAAVVEFYVTGVLLDALFESGSRPEI